MKKHLFLLFLSCLAGFHSLYAQCIVFKIRLNDCVSCYNGLHSFDAMNVKLPLYVVFPSKNIKDSSDILYKLNIKLSNIGLLFNDSLYNKVNETNKDSSTLSLLNGKGEINFQAGLKNINATDTIASLNISLREAQDQAVYVKWSPSFKVTFDESIGRIRIYERETEKFLFSLSARDFDYSLLRSKLVGEELKMFDSLGLQLNTGSEVKGIYSWFDVDTRNNLYAMLLYRNVRLSDGKLDLTDNFALVSFSKEGKIKSISPVYEPENSTHKQFTGRFFRTDNNGFIATTHDWQNWYSSILKKNKNAKIYPLSLFVKEREVLNYKENVFVELPEIHRYKYFENFLSEEFCQYPIVTFQLVNQLFDLKSRKSVYISDSNDYRSNYLKSGDFVAGSITHKESFENLGLTIDSLRNRIYNINRLSNLYSFDVYDMNLKLLKRVPLLIAGLNKANLSDIDIYNGVLYLREFNNVNYLEVPLILFE